MSRPRYLADHDLNEHIVAGVIRQEPAIEFIRARDVGMDECTDSEILDYAHEMSLIVVSHDVNTMTDAAYRRLAEGKSFPGLLLLQQSSPIGPMIDQLQLIWSASDLDEWQDQIVFPPF